MKVNEEKKNRNFGLDLIRTIAIVSVMMCHTIPIFVHQIHNHTLDLFFNIGYWSAGYYGVEIFFILSGYLIGNIFIKSIVNTEDKKSKWKSIFNFWNRRWFRTLPNFLLFFFINWALVYLLHQKIPSNYLLFRVFTLSQGIFFGGSDFYGVSWSLAVEEWFYLLLPIFFVLNILLLKNNKKAFKGSLVLMLAIPTLLKLIFSINEPQSDYAQWVFHYSTLYKLDSIFYGLLLAYLFQNEKMNRFILENRKNLLTIGILGTILSLLWMVKYVLINTQISFMVFLFQIICSISLLLTFPYFIKLELKSITIGKLISFLSITSYSLYLIHTPVLYIVEYLSKIYQIERTFANNLIIFIFVWCISLVGAKLIYNYFELPFLKLRDRISLKITRKSKV